MTENEKKISESLKLMRAADLIATLLKIDTSEFEDLRKTATYKNKAYDHYIDGMSIVFFDAAMYMRYLIDVVSKKCAENRKYFNLVPSDPDDPSFKMVSDALEQLTDQFLCKSAYDGKFVADYKDATKQFLEPVMKKWNVLSEQLWSDVEKNKTPSSTAYSDLANAILTLSARDYESAISGISHEANFNAEASARMCEKFAETQAKNYTSVDMEAVYQRIRRSHRKLKEIVNENAVDIVADWKQLSKSGYFSEAKRIAAKYRCPNCGDALRPEAPDKIMGVPRIGCCGCNLSVPIPSDALKKIGSISIKKKHGGNKSRGGANELR